MKIVNLIQGSPEWHAHRAKYFNASDAPAMLGLSPYKTRSELIRERATGLVAEVDAATQRRFDMGHRSEALARPLAEKIIGEELSPLVGVADDGPYSSSFDGLNFMQTLSMEHKQLNDRLRAAMVEGCTGADLPEDYQVQMEHQCLTEPALERVLFIASKWADDGTLLEERHCWYTPNLELRARIVAGWAQFDADVAAYQPEAAAAPTPVGRAPGALPALRIEVAGAVTSSNLPAFKEHALAVIRSVNRDLKTDEDFANADEAVKWAAEVKTKLEAAKQHALSQTESIDALFRTIDEIVGEADTVRLDLERLIAARKTARREEICTESRAAFTEHLQKLDEALGEPIMTARSGPVPTPDYAAAIKGKRSFALMRDAVQALNVRAMADATVHADRIKANITALAASTTARPELAGLFPDRLLLVLKQPDDLAAVITSRVLEHDRVEAERQARAAAAAVPAPEPAAAAEPAVVLALTPAPQLTQVQHTAAANEPAPTSVPTLRIGAIAERLGWKLTAEELRGLGIEPVTRERGATLYHEHQFPAICAAVARRANEAAAAHAQRLAA